MPDDRDPKKMRSGVSNFCDLTVIGTAGQFATVRVKAKSESELVAKVGKYTIGKPAEIPITSTEDGVRGVMVLNA